jgi:dihydroorotate dehydrogenase
LQGEGQSREAGWDEVAFHVILYPMFYRKVLKPIFFKFDPESVHDFFIATGEFLGKFKSLKELTNFFYGYKGGDISKVVDGLNFKTPFILAAGFDCNGRLVNILPDVSLGGVEVGSVTARPCEGNEKPRMRRLVKSQSILVNKGLRNEGVEKIIERLKIKRLKDKEFVIGVSIARSNDKESSSDEEGIADYFQSFKRLNEENVGDYYTLNISCPNSFGGETFANQELLSQLLAKLAEIKCDKPVYVKMPINLGWQEFDELLKILNDFQMIKGVIIGNLNKDYNYLEYRYEASKEYKGGFSGKPCFELSNKLIKRTRETYGGRFTIIGCGGVMSPQDMMAKFEAGSDLVQLITGMIFNGPGFMKELANRYFKSIS